ncbi:tyrosine-type recombinase/integrase [Vogesella sp. XCS3]|uniref:tyrosine-type recombinase/integrase n=1 Tax=Vogesella sp. XCS3 TaxID=2877939 RepID=UPI00210636AC|nr:tyrosine-type recombinase/integrase [Vogesella sp. XCS3]
MSADLARARCTHWLQLNRDTYALGTSTATSNPAPTLPTTPTLQEVYEEYTKSKQLRSTTLATYGKTLRLYLSAYINQPLTALTSKTVRAIYSGLKSKISVAKANAALSLIKALWRWWSATQEIELPDIFTALAASGEKKKTKAKDDVLIDSQIQELGRNLNKLREQKKNFILTGLYTGLRLSELLRLTPSSIDQKCKTIKIDNTKNGKPHTLPISTHLMNVLIELCKGKANSTPLFPAQAKNWCSSISKLVNIPFSAHTLRRTFASQATKININAYTIKALLNHHAGSDITQLHYIRLNVDDLKSPMQKICSHINNLIYNTSNTDEIHKTPI